MRSPAAKEGPPPSPPPSLTPTLHYPLVPDLKAGLAGWLACWYEDRTQGTYSTGCGPLGQSLTTTCIRQPCPQWITLASGPKTLAAPLQRGGLAVLPSMYLARVPSTHSLPTLHYLALQPGCRNANQGHAPRDGGVDGTAPIPNITGRQSLQGSVDFLGGWWAAGGADAGLLPLLSPHDMGLRTRGVCCARAAQGPPSST